MSLARLAQRASQDDAPHKVAVDSIRNLPGEGDGFVKMLFFQERIQLIALASERSLRLQFGLPLFQLLCFGGAVHHPQMPGQPAIDIGVVGIDDQRLTEKAFGFVPVPLIVEGIFAERGQGLDAARIDRQRVIRGLLGQRVNVGRKILTGIAQRDVGLRQRPVGQREIRIELNSLLELSDRLRCAARHVGLPCLPSLQERLIGRRVRSRARDQRPGLARFQLQFQGLRDRRGDFLLQSENSIRSEDTVVVLRPQRLFARSANQLHIHPYTVAGPLHPGLNQIGDLQLSSDVGQRGRGVAESLHRGPRHHIQPGHTGKRVDQILVNTIGKEFCILTTRATVFEGQHRDRLSGSQRAPATPRSQSA